MLACVQVRGGVEYAFTSTTTDEQVARNYAQRGKVGMIIEVQMGMVDRGAELEWLSQYPCAPCALKPLQIVHYCSSAFLPTLLCGRAEKEICFAPLTGVEVQGTRVEDSTLIVEARLSVNLSALTIEETVAKMQRSQVQLLGNMVDELAFAGAPKPALAPIAALRSELSKRDPSYFNDAENFKEATIQVRTTPNIYLPARALVPPSEAPSGAPAWSCY